MTITVYGIPAPQGSKRPFRNPKTGQTILVESSAKVKPWRTAVEQAVMLAYPPGSRTDQILCRGPVALDVTFTLPRPKSAKSGARPATRPDLDKLVRSTKDALKTAGVYEDDGRVVSLIATKEYPGGQHIDDGEESRVLQLPGAVIHVECV